MFEGRVDPLRHGRIPPVTTQTLPRTTSGWVGLARDLPPVDHIVVERVEREIYGVDLPKLLAPILDPEG